MSDDRPVPAGLRLITDGNRGSLGTIAVLSAIAGLLEAATLVCLTTYAVSLQGSGSSISLAFVTFSPNAALPAAIAGVVAKVALNYIIVRLSTSLATTTLRDQRSAALNDFFAADYATQTNEPLGSLQEILTNNVDRVAGITLTITNTITSSLNLAALVVGALFVRPAAALFMIAGGAIVALVLHPLRGLSHRLATRHVASNAVYAQSVTDGVRMAREVRLFDAAGPLTQAVDRSERRSSDSYRSSRLVQGIAPQLYQSAALLLVIGGLQLARNQDVEPATLGAVVLLLVRSLAYLQGALGGRQQLADQVPHLERLAERRNSYRRHRAVRGTQQPDDLRHLELTDVGFSYEPGRPALIDFSLEIPRGTVIGVIGPSGSGKSTLSELLLGLRDPTSGRLTAGGVDLREIEPQWWSRHVSFVPQEARLVNGTVRTNIEFFRERDDAAMTAAATEANLLDEILRLPQGFETELGELGGALSGGQRQRLCIARALFGQPHVLLLDEPTSALDGISESVVLNTIRDLAGAVTVIIVTHRMSTLAICDQVAVLDRGRLAAFEPPQSLDRSDGFFGEVLRLSMFDEQEPS